MAFDQAVDALAGLMEGFHGVRYDFSSAAPSQPSYRVRRVSLTESISTPYALQLELGTEEPLFDIEALLGKNATLTWARHRDRSVHGIVDTVREGAVTTELSIIYVTIVPALAALAHTSSSRIFENRTIQAVVQEVLEESLAPFGRKVVFDLESREDAAKHEYIVQHRETDLQFVSRLLASQGLWYYFDHTTDSSAVERLVITDASSKAKPIDEDDPSVELAQTHQGSTTQEMIRAFHDVHAIRTTGVRVRQYNWTNPEVIEQEAVALPDVTKLALEHYEHGEFPGHEYGDQRYKKYETKLQAGLRAERYQVDRTVREGISDATLLRPGHIVQVEGIDYLITSVHHTGGADSGHGQVGREGDYENHFTCLPTTKPFRPRSLDKPRISGVQTALVVDRSGNIKMPDSSREGEDVVMDAHGRIRVKFHWDLTQAGTGGTSSCWVRCSQIWAGRDYGFQFIPRVGMEVIVQFIDGDPDQPLVTGTVYNGLNPPPYPKKATQSGIKTASSVDRTRYNELRFEDAKDNEQIFVRAQKDYVEDVLNDHTTTVHGAQKQLVKKSQSETVHGNQSLSVGGKRVKTVGGDKEHGEEITIKGERKTTVTKKHTEVFEDEHEVTVSKPVTETYLETHDRVVTGVQTFKAEADKIEQVVGRYELTTDAAYVLNQGGTKLTFEGDAVALDAASNVSVKQGGSSVDIDTGGNIALKTTSSITLEVGPNKITISTSGIEVNGMQIALTAGPSELALTPASAKLASVNTSVEATAICAIKGTAMLGLN